MTEHVVHSGIDALDLQCVNALRFLSVDMVQKADSGHPGLPLGAAPMLYVLWMRWLKHNPRDPTWPDRDRFVLSAGHGSALLYSLLHLTGYDLGIEDLRSFRQWGSRAPGHPERGVTAGVEVTTGPLGQGLANGIGMAVAERQLAASYNRPDLPVVDHQTYIFASDGDLMEGVASEAASLAGHLALGKITCLYDDNRVTLAAGTAATFTEDRARRFEAYGWHTLTVADGNDLQAIDSALTAARAQVDRPSLILVRTHIGWGSPVQDSYKAHGSPLGVEGVRRTKEHLGWPVTPDFLVPPEVRKRMGAALDRGRQEQVDWDKRRAAYALAYPTLSEELDCRLQGVLAKGWDEDVPEFLADSAGIATRDASAAVVNAICRRVPALLGGSADLDPSTKTSLKGFGDFGPEQNALGSADSSGLAWSYTGRNLHFGVREHAMGAIVNGLAVHGGFRAFGATFLIFSDYMRPPLRLAALMHLPVIHVYTHDSLAVGEDGPTHQPVEQLANLRAVPNLVVIRPADANETAEAWKVAMETRDRPVALILTRQPVPTIDRIKCYSAAGLRNGAYVLRDTSGAPPVLILMASGSEVRLILGAAERLEAEGIAVRCVSIPSWELFDALPEDARQSVLPDTITARLAVELGVRQGWERYVGENGDMLGVNKFGASAPADVLLREYGFTVEAVYERARALLR